MTGKKRVLLPANVRPEHYTLRLTPNLQDFTFLGDETIAINILEPTDTITLHCADITIQDACLYEKDFAHRNKPVATELDAEAETVTFKFNRKILRGQAFLEISFRGTLNDKMRGFYRSSYEVNGEERWMAVTQFEATDARRAFPCWDEPAQKATFSIGLTIPKNLTALSNMPVSVRTFTDDEKETIIFKLTPVMSTYLVAFAVGELESIGSKTKNGVAVKICTIPGKSEQGQFALDVAVRALEFYEEYFGVPYPLPKMDLLAIPDFAAGAMENWGLVTYREICLLNDPANTSSVRKQYIAIVVAHELAHQWFGNLVTMEWWTHLWLNEGFATWMEYLAVDRLFPEWHMWEGFMTRAYSSALGLDALRSSHPIEVEVHHPGEIGQIFDKINYEKGGSVIRMLHAYIGADKFREGLKLYFRKFAYRNATTEDLWDAFAQASRKPVKKMMDRWTKQAGYPVVTLKRTGKKWTMEQEQFLSGGEKLNADEMKKLWDIPLAENLILKSKKKNFRMPDTKLNPGHIVLARINYTSAQWNTIRSKVITKSLSTIDRFGVLSDAYALAKAGRMPAIQLLDLLSAYSSETDCIVLREVIDSLGGLHVLVRSLSKTAQYHYRNFARRTLKKSYLHLGWDEQKDEPVTQTLFRPSVIGAMGTFQANDALVQARRQFDLMQSGKLVIHPDLRSTVYCLTAKQGGQELYDTFLKMYREAEQTEEKLRILGAMGQFPDAELLWKTLKFALSDEVRKQDTYGPIISVAGNPIGGYLAWELIKENWTQLRERYSGTLMLMARFVEAVDIFSSEKDAQMIEQFFKDNPCADIQRTVDQVLERTRNRARWLDRDGPDIAEWLRPWCPDVWCPEFTEA